MNYEEDDIASDSDPDAALERAHKGIDDAFDNAEAKHGNALMRAKMKVKVQKEEDTYGKFPFKLNRYTIDNRMRPVKLWKGGVNVTDMPPLVSGKEEAKEISTVALVVPTQFVGGGKVGRR